LTALAEIDEMGEETFVTAFGSVFEHSPWVARDAWQRRPFATLDGLHAAFEETLRSAPRAAQIELIRAHPELAGREAQEGELTAASGREQASAGLDRLSAAEHARLEALNRDYRERFGFPLVVCVREHTKQSLLDWGRVRLARSREEEIATALGEIAKIARLRLRDVLE
jgi:2-oxo-4-hydroxy-4-carboxy-5-ureidoimidazoline decarboxylase